MCVYVEYKANGKDMFVAMLYCVSVLSLYDMGA